MIFINAPNFSWGGGGESPFWGREEKHPASVWQYRDGRQEAFPIYQFCRKFELKCDVHPTSIRRKCDLGPTSIWRKYEVNPTGNWRKSEVIRRKCEVNTSIRRPPRR